jgi:succinate dehydrogenase / fumarate reductase cytochrome b subunit
MSSRDPTPLAGPIRPIPLDPDATGLAKGLSTSIGKKYVMGWTGLMWCFFLVVHLAGNFALFVGPEALNAYAHKLESLGPLLIAAELVLVVLFLLHVILAIMVTLENRAARPNAYGSDKGKGEKTLASSTMIWTGLYVLVFLVTHLINIKFASHGTFGEDGIKDIYATTMAIFQSPFYVIFYVVGVCLLGLHVSHGVQSGCRTIGIHGPKITPKIEWTGIGFGVVVALGYASIPLWALLFHGGAK